MSFFLTAGPTKPAAALLLHWDGSWFKIGAASLADGRVLVAGSDATVEVYDPAVGRFELSRGRVDAEHQFATVTALTDGRALIAGGYDPGIRPTASTWISQP